MRLIAGVALAALAVLHAQPAHAHGGVIAPPPNPQAKGPPGGSGGVPNHVDPGFGGPVVTPGSGGSVTPRRASRRKTPLTSTFETSWELWWRLNRDGFLPVRERTRRVVVTPSPESGGVRGATAWEAQRRGLVDTKALPFLLEVLDPARKQPADVRASACIALGKIARDGSAADVLLEHLEDPRAPDIVRESAALGLGLLRRSEPKLRLKPIRYEIVRGRLLKVFDQISGGKKTLIPVRTRAFAMYALGLLGDQPFRDDPLSKDGRLISKLLWERLGVPYRDRELHIALLTALGRQPRAGIPEGIQDALREIVMGKTTHGHRWDLLKRAHAVTAVARLGGVGGHAFLLRITLDKRKPLVTRLAAELAIADRAPHLAAAERSAALRVMRRTFLLEQELLAVGLANLAMGRLVGADLAAGSTRVLEFDKADKLLLERAEQAPWYLRGFAALGLALAAREGTADLPAAVAFRRRASAVLLAMARASKEPATVRAAGVVALGLLGMPENVPALTAIARRGGEDPEVRAHAALALGQTGSTGGGVVEALSDLVGGSAPETVRSHAALALSLLAEGGVAAQLIKSLDVDTSTRRLAAATRALGRLGELSAVEPLIAAARSTDARPLVRAMAIVSLGRLLDPEPRSSLLRLSLGAAYPARSRALHEALTIL